LGAPLPRRFGSKGRAHIQFQQRTAFAPFRKRQGTGALQERKRPAKRFLHSRKNSMAIRPIRGLLVLRPMSTTAAEHPELLAPAGDWDCVRAAVANGADAVYFGLPRFNARLRAHNFTEAELPEIVAFCHRHGVKAYVAFNTLVFTGELEAAADCLRLRNRAGVDALIVQDIGLVRLAGESTPELPIHASTQAIVVRLRVVSPRRIPPTIRAGMPAARRRATRARVFPNRVPRWRWITESASFFTSPVSDARNAATCRYAAHTTWSTRSCVLARCAAWTRTALALL